MTRTVGEQRRALVITAELTISAVALVALNASSIRAGKDARVERAVPGEVVSIELAATRHSPGRSSEDRASEPSAPAAGLADPLAWAEDVVTIRVVDETGVLPADVAVIVARGAEQTESGALELSVAEVAGSTVCALAHGRSVDTAQVGDRPRAEHVLSLGVEATISGVLRMLDDTPVPEGARVFAWRSCEMTSVERGLHAYASLPKGFAAEVERDGTFVVEGLRPGSVYGVTAFGGGVLVESSAEIHRLVAPIDGVELSAGFVGAVEVDLDGPDAACALLYQTASPLPDLAGLYETDSDHSTSWWVKWRGQPRAVSGRNWSIRLAGLDRPDSHLQTLPIRILVTGPSREDVRVAGTFIGTLPVLGQAKITIETEPVVGPSDVQQVLVPLEGVPANWAAERLGSLLIRFDVPADESSAALTDRGRMSPARVRLLPDSGQVRDALTLRASPGTSGRTYQVPLVPEGSYTFWFFDDMAGASIPNRLGDGRPIEVRAGETTAVDMTDVPMGTVELTVLRPDGRLFTGSLGVDLLIPLQKPGRYMCLSKASNLFGGPPYRLSPVLIDDLVEGRCFVNVNSIHLGREYRTERPLLDVERGKRAALTVRMVEPPLPATNHDTR